MSYDLLLGPRRRRWSRDSSSGDRPDLVSPPRVPEVPGVPSPAATASDLARRARELDERIRVRRVDGGATVSTRFKWG